MCKAKDINVFNGCMLGGAVGDALGYPVKDMTMLEIKIKYGEQGIRDYVLKNGVAQISDNTQLTLFTVNGMMLATTRLKTRGILGPFNRYLGLCYKDWLKTQGDSLERDYHNTTSWLCNVPRLHDNRCIGGTCFTALGYCGIAGINNPINNNKDCAGMARVSPIGVYMTEKTPLATQLASFGAEAAAITHGHPLGYMPASVLVGIIAQCTRKETRPLKNIVTDAMEVTADLFYDSEYLNELKAIIDKALALTDSDVSDEDAIKLIGGGRCAEEVLAIAVFCAVRYSDDFEAAVLAAVNHDGNSAATGSITGTIMGTYLGADAIPERFLEHLELKDVILEITNDMFQDCPLAEHSPVRDEKWESKYIRGDFAM